MPNVEALAAFLDPTRFPRLAVAFWSISVLRSGDCQLGIRLVLSSMCLFSQEMEW